MTAPTAPTAPLYIIIATGTRSAMAYTLAIEQGEEDSIVTLCTIDGIKSNTSPDNLRASLKSWGVWSTPDRKLAQRALGAARSNARRWHMDPSQQLGVYAVNG